MNTKQLRQKILDLAIRGKLVPQDPADEPVSVLLERVRAEKERLIKAGKIKRGKAEASTDKPHYGELPFDVPESWEWCAFGEVCDYGNCENETPDNIPDDAWILDLEDIEKDTGKILAYITKSEREFYSNKHSFRAGQVLYSNLRPYLNKVLVAPKDGYCTSEIIPLKFEVEMDSGYIRYFLMSSYFLAYANLCSYGVKMPRLGATNANKAMIPLPPLNEQKRISAAIESAFAVIDEIESNKTGLRSAVAAAKSKILSLAICGKLVPQDPSDEPASALLERIRAEREALVKAGKIKRAKADNAPPVTRDNPYYENLPQGWELARLDDITNIVMGQSPSGDSVSANADGIEFHQGKIFFTNRLLASSGQYTNDSSKIAEQGSVLLCVRAPVGTVNITDRNIAIGRGLCSLTSLGGVTTDFIFHWLTACQQDFIEQATGTTFQAITTDVVRQEIVPVPPIAEQQRIVAAIESAYAVLDSISSNIR